MEEIIKRANEALDKAKETGEIPDWVWKKCKGVGVITCTEMGLVASVTRGDGLVIVHNHSQEEEEVDDTAADGGSSSKNNTWGAPSALSFGGFDVGVVAGKATKQVFLFPMTMLGVQLLAGENSLKLGVKAGVAAGPAGREVEAGPSIGTGGVGVIHSYVFQEGALLSLALSSTTVCAENDYNEEFYGKKKVTAEDILMKPGAVTIPEGKGVEELQSKLMELST